MGHRLRFGVAVLVLASACSGRRPPVVVPSKPPVHVEDGLASWYGVEEAGRATASGELMDPERFTAAHRSLPFGSLVRVTDLETRRHVDVVINDRGPFVRGRIIDLSFAAAREIDLVNRGVARVRIQVVGLDGSLAERRWRVQLGSFSSGDLAQDLLTLVQAEGFSPAVISRHEEGGTLYYRVWVGAYYERDGAERLARELRAAGHAGFVLLAAAASP
jgi:rare lipoprotein A